MTPQPLEISVALCTRNGAKYLPEQVRSICRQTRRVRQIVVSDDGSSDDSVEVVRRTVQACGMADAIELTVFENAKPLGVTRNFEQAIRACRHPLIALCDQDDAWPEARLARLAAAFESRPELQLVHSDARLVDGQLAPLGIRLFEALEAQPWELDAIAQGRGFDVFLRRNLVTGATTMIRRELLDAALPFSIEWVHDEWLAMIAATTACMDVIREPLLDYRQHGNNQIGAKKPSLGEKIRKAMDERGQKHFQRLRRAEALLERLLALGDRVPAGFVELQRQKVAHQRFRAMLPGARMARVLPVLREARSGRYDRFGRGKQAVMQDLLERG